MTHARNGGAERGAARVVVIGLGRFGSSTARTLAELGYEVIAIDIRERPIEDIAEHVTLAAQGDGTDEEMLRSLAVDRCDYGIVAQGESLEASLLATLLLKRIGIPRVVAKAKSDLHGELLHRVGADQVVFPERDAGDQLAHTLSVQHVSDYISLSSTTGVAKLSAPVHFIGSTLGELCGPHAAWLEVLLIQRGRTLIGHPAADERVQAGDVLVVAGTDAAIDAFAAPDDQRDP